MEIHQHPSATTHSSAQERWNERYHAGRQPGGGEVSPWVLAHHHYLTGGAALDVACGVGRHTAWLAEHGYTVDAVDISAAGLQKLAELLKARSLSARVRLIHADLGVWRPEAERYDLAIVTRYLNRDLFAPLADALVPGGLILYSSFHTDVLNLRDFEPKYLLQPGELLLAFSGFEILAYEERRWAPGSDEFADCTSSILARKPLQE